MSIRPLSMRPFPWERPEFEGRKDRTSADRDARDDPFSARLKVVHDLEEPSSVVASIPRLLREASEAIRAAEARASAMEAKMRQAIEAAEARANEAEDRAAELEERALRAVQAAEHRADVAEARLKTAETWLGRVREALSQPA
jgi:predicted S18 family serine protease